MQFTVKRKAAGSGYRRQIAEYQKLDRQLGLALSRAGRKVRTEIVKALGAATGYPAKLLKREFRYWSPKVDDARLQWTGHPHAVDSLGWIGRRFRKKGRFTGDIRVKKWPGTGAAKVFPRSWVAPSGRLFSRYKSAREPYRVVARGIRRLMDETGLRERARGRFVSEVRERVAKVLAKRGGR